MANGLAGIMMAAVGVFHEAAGLLIYRAPLAEMLGAGLVNTVLPNLDPAHHGRQAAFWFLVAGGAGAVVRRMGNGQMPVIASSRSMICAARSRTDGIPMRSSTSPKKPRTTRRRATSGGMPRDSR